MDLPANASRDEILEAMNALPEHDHEGRKRLFWRFTAAAPRPGVRMRHGGRPGAVETCENGRWRSTGSERR